MLRRGLGFADRLQACMHIHAYGVQLKHPHSESPRSPEVEAGDWGHDLGPDLVTSKRTELQDLKGVRVPLG